MWLVVGQVCLEVFFQSGYTWVRTPANSLSGQTHNKWAKFSPLTGCKHWIITSWMMSCYTFHLFYYEIYTIFVGFFYFVGCVSTVLYCTILHSTMHYTLFVYLNWFITWPIKLPSLSETQKEKTLPNDLSCKASSNTTQALTSIQQIWPLFKHHIVSWQSPSLNIILFHENLPISCWCLAWLHDMLAPAGCGIEEENGRTPSHTHIHPNPEGRIW